jgi:hypothetical protein
MHRPSGDPCRPVCGDLNANLTDRGHRAKAPRASSRLIGAVIPYAMRA